MESPPLAQKVFYGDAGGPPMLFEEPRSKPPPRSGKRRKLVPPKNPSTLEAVQKMRERSIFLASNENELSPSDLPGDFPQEFAFRSLAIYSLLRTLSVKLRLSPFTPNAFLRALYLPFPSKLSGQVHVALLRALLPELGYTYRVRGKNFHKRRLLDNVRWPLRGGDNLTYLDGFSWPLFYDDYCHLTADILWAKFNDETSYVDMRNLDLDPASIQDYQHSSLAFGYEGDGVSDDESESLSSDGNHENEESLQQLLAAQRPTVEDVELERGNRAGRNRAYFGMDQLNSDSSFGENDVVEDEDSDFEYRHAASRSLRNQVPAHPVPSTQISGNFQDTSGLKVQLGEGDTSKDSQIGNKAPAGAPVMHIRGGGDGPSFTSNGSLPIGFDLQDERCGEVVSQPVTSLQDQHESDDKETCSSAEPTIAIGSKSSTVKLDDNATRPTTTEVKSGSVASKNNTASGDIKDFSAVKISIFSSGNVHSRRKLPLSKSISVKAVESNTQRRPTITMHTSNSATKESAYVPQNATMNGSKKGPIEMQMMAMYSNHAVSHYRPLKPNSTRGEDPVSATKTPQRKPRRRQLQVEDHLAKILTDVICGKEVEPSANADPDSSKSSSKFTSEFQEKMENERWAHFDPLKAIRSGVPHFSLSLEQKLVILEFLTDQLLSVAEITAELQKRKTIESCYKVPYGVWPSKEQFEALDNADECGVCQGEGELLCCDGCVRSYHRSCLAMNALEELPEGKWLCPECRLVDPSLFGPLRAGAKSILEWFSISDLQSSLLEEETRLAVRQPPYEHDAIDTFADPTYKELTGSEMTSDSPDMTTRNTAFTAPDPCPGQEFMVAHGYLFCRQLDEARSSSSSVSLLSRPVTLSVLEKLDPAIRNAWPLVQVPTQETVSSPHFPTAKTYLLPLEAYDPSFYKNKYRSAPVPLMLRAGGSTHVLKLMAADFESECCQNSTYRLSDALSRDFRLDTAVYKSLLSETALHDPYAVFRGYLLKLEGQIRKAHLVDEFWEAGTDESRQGRWLKAVRSAKSIQRLARLLLQLVDYMNPRAFDSGWFQNHQCKGDEVITDLSKNLVDLPSDWTKEKESRKRIWERVTPDAILHVCETQKCSLDGFVQGIKEHISPLLVAKRSKRKRLKEKVSTAFSDKGKMNVGNQLKEETMPTNMDPTSESMVTTGLQRAAVAEPPTALNTRVIAEKVSTLESAWSASNPLGQKQGGPSGVALVGQDISTTHAQSGNNGEVTATVNHDSTENENRQAQDKQIIVERKEQELSKPHEAVQTSESISPDTEATTADRATFDSSAKIPACNGDKNGPTRNDRKKRSLSATPTRRRTRRSVGRMAVAAGDNDLQGEVAPIGLTSKKILTSFDSIEMHIELQKMSKIPQVEKIVKGGFQRQLEWPVAGRLPFATVGNLPPQEVRRLARNAGVVKAPYVAYQTAHEVGQVCFAHSWRKDTEQCKSYEELALQIRVLESFIDHQTVQSCESIARRGKNQIQKIVKLVQRDQSNGVPEYFVVSKTKNKGAWVSSEHIEVSALTLHNFTRRQRHIERREMYLKAKAQKKAAEEARQKRKNEAARHARSAEEAVKRSNENEERRLKAAEKAASQRQEKSRATAQQIQHASKHATLSAQLQQMTPETRKWTEISNAIIMQHQLDLSKLAKQCQDAGIPILEDRQTQLRQSTLMRLKGIGFLKVPDEKLVEIMLLSEKAALRGMSTIEASRTLANPTASNSMQSSNSQNFGNMHNSYGNPSRPVGDIAAGSGGGPHGMFEPPRQVQPSQPPNNVWNNAMPHFLGALMPIQNAGAPVPQNGYGNNSYGGNTGRGHHGVPPSQNFSQQLPNVLPQFQPHLGSGSLGYQQNIQGVFQLPGNSQTGRQQYQGSNHPTSGNQYQGSNHPTSGNQYQGSNHPISGNHQEDLQQQIQRLQLLQMQQQQQQRHHGQQQFGGPSNNGFW